MKLVTAEQMRAIDRRAIEGIGIPGLELMENAGRGIAEFIRDRVFAGKPAGKRVAVLCGAGNNGGDGYVIARYLHSWGAVPQVFLLADREKIKGDALANLTKLDDLEMEVFGAEITPEPGALSEDDLLIDAVFGTGFHGEVREPLKSILETVNQAGVPVLAVDTPSGVDINNGSIGGVGVRATYTATLALPKLGHYFYPVRGYCGHIEVIDIGIPEQVVEEQGIETNLITDEMVCEWVPQHDPTAHKGDCGKLFIVAGSTGMTGAAVMAAESAMRAGSGLVKVGVPASLNDILEVKLTEAMTRPLPELRRPRCLALRSLGVILEEMRVADALCIGPGIGRHHETIELVQRLVKKLDRPAVIDADGLFPFSGETALLRECEAPLVLTPHIGEFARLTGLGIGEVKADRIKSLQTYASEIGKVVLLKGAPTLVATPNGKLYVSQTGNPGMATGGSGDVLTGVIGALLGYGIEATYAAAAGAYLHGLAGDIAATESGVFGLVAGDILSSLPDAFIEVLG